jgi:hypothetical protein
MLWVCFLLALVSVCAVIAVLCFRTKFTIAVINMTGKEKPSLVKLKAIKLLRFPKLQERLNREVKIFNTLGLVMDCLGGVPTLLISELQKLCKNPKHFVLGADGFKKLMYLYACAMLLRTERALDAFSRKQLVKNCLLVFFSGLLIKKHIAKHLRGKDCLLFPVPQPQYKLLLGAVSCFVREPDFEILANGEAYHMRRICSGSYITYYSGSISVRKGIDVISPVEFFDVRGTCTFIKKGLGDKMRYDLGHTADTFYCVAVDKTVAIYVEGKKTFGSSLCEKDSDLRIYINLENGGKLYIVHASSKSEASAIVTRIKHKSGQVCFMRTKQELLDIVCAEKLFSMAHNSHCVKGEKLKEKHAHALKYVPTLSFPTLVYTIDCAMDFFAVVDSFAHYKIIARAGQNLNIVCLYSALNDSVREVINAFTDKDEAKELIACGIFIFFINKVTADLGAVNYLCLMSDAMNQAVKTISRNRDAEVTMHVSHSFPITHTVFIRNTRNKVVNAIAAVKLQMPRSVVLRHGANIFATNLKTGRTTNYKLPNGAKVYTELGKSIEQSEYITQSINVVLNTKLGFCEEKEYKIIKNENELSGRARRAAFVGSITDIKIKSDNARVAKLLALPVSQSISERLCDDIKRAIRNADADVFFALCATLREIPSDIYFVLMEKLLGIKLVSGTVQLLPCIQITGSFELSFMYHDKVYNFTVTERGGGFFVKHGDIEQRNFGIMAIS